ncbi:MAG: CBS domain-containing protein [Methanomassiliicoccales archaeon]
MSAKDKLFIDSLVADVYDLMGQPAATVGVEAKLGDVVDVLIKDPLSRKVYVVDAEGKLLGVVDAETVLRLIGYRVGIHRNAGISVLGFLRDTLKENAVDFLRKVRPVTKDTKLTAALQIMLDDNMADLPVVDDHGRLVGELMSMELLTRARTLFQREK